MKELENTFTWSASRNNSFRFCERQYWWMYYGAWGGWEVDAPREARTAYMLKNLSNRWAWVGTVVHETIEEILLRYQRPDGGELAFETPPVDVEAELERATERMRVDWVSSKRGYYHVNPKKNFGLAEHEYAEPVPREEWKAMNQKVKDALRAFLTSDLFRHIQDSDSSLWLPIEQLDQFDFEGTGIWVVIDFALRHPDGRVDIYDWKTGEVTDANRTQLGCYTIYVKGHLGVQADQVTNHLVYLGEGIRDVSFPMSEDDLGETRGVMRSSIAAMRNRIRDRERNHAVRDDFAMTDDPAKCAVCVFRRLCGRE